MKLAFLSPASLYILVGGCLEKPLAVKSIVSARMGLEEYQAKRYFKKTPEPGGEMEGEGTPDDQVQDAEQEQASDKKKA